MERLRSSVERSVTTVPEIVYDKSLEEPDIPYVINIDAQKVGELFMRVGMPPGDIEETRITVQRRHEPKAQLAYYLMGSNEIVLAGDNIWAFFQEDFKLADEIASGTRRPSKFGVDFVPTLYTTRLGKYLATAPTERSTAFAQRLLQRGTERFTASLLAHEGKHRVDYLANSKGFRAVHYSLLAAHVSSFLAITAFCASFLESKVGTRITPVVAENFHFLVSGVSIGGGIGAGVLVRQVPSVILNLLNPIEIRARRAQEREKRNPKWKGLITIKPKMVISPQNSG